MTASAEPRLPREARDLLLRQRARLQELQARLDERDRADTDPIAIVGMGCRFPGGASSPEAFWQILRDGVDTVTVVPGDRFDVDAVYSDDPDAADRIYTRHGAFLREDVAAFDAEFFGIAPREAEAIDPQQRLLLEVAWETLEHAGMAADRRARQRVGVFVGCMTQDYASLSTGYGDHRHITAYTGTGTGNCFLAGRVAYVMGFSGPALTIDTACSSSLVALHLAAQALRHGECDAALAGGVNLILSPAVSMFLCRSRALSADGRCKTFDAEADGYGRGEGCGLVLLKRLSRAQADGDSILAVMVGSAVNHDGASAGLTVPNATAQEELLRQALESGGLRPSDVDYLEAHGTGTALGDPLELAAVGAVFGDRGEKPPLVVGSVKANVGHMEAAAGIAAVLKVVLSLQHQAIPQQLHLHRPSPHIPWAALPVEVPRTLTPWPGGASTRVAGISSFGLSGTNAHLLIAEAAPTAVPEGRDAITPPDTSRVLTLSARTAPALDELAERVRQHLDDHPELPHDEVCFTANCGRALHEYRLAIVSDDCDTLRRQLADAATGQASTFIRRGMAADLAPRVGLMFSGQGAQRLGMGRALYARAPVFRDVFDRCDAVFRDIRGRSLREMCFEHGRLDLLTPTDTAQPALFAFEIALAEQWRTAGLEIDAVIGHSVGEFAAAAFAGVFTIEDGMRLVCERGRLMQGMPPGAMGAFEIEEASAREWVCASALSLAAVNSPTQVVVSGTREELERFEALARQRGVRGQRLNVSHAFHSSLMDPILDEFETAVSRVTLRPPQTRLFSNLTGRQSDAELVDSSYWRRHLREPVLFARALTALVQPDDEPWTLLEVGPRSTLSALAADTLGSRARAVASISRGQHEYKEMLSAAAELFVQGVLLDWRALGCTARRKALMPTYPFQRKRCWLSPSVSADRPVAAGSTTPMISVEWKPLAGRGDQRADAGPYVLIGGRQAAALAATLRAGGRSAFQISARSDGSLDGLEVLGSLESPTVVHLTTFDAIETAGADGDLDAACQFALGSLLHAAQAVLRSQRASNIRLWTIAPGGWDVPGHPMAMHPLAASVHAFVASIAAEHPEIHCTCVDTPLEPDLATISALLQQQSVEPRLALRDGTLYVARLARSELVARPYDVSPDRGAWLVTGGLGALGRRTAAWLVDRGARDLILVGRGRPSDAAEADIERMRQRGVTVRVESVDVSKRADVERLLGGLHEAGVTVYGVVHAAGVLADRTVSNMRLDDLRVAMAGKAVGAQHLLDLLLPSVEVCVLYGSIAGVLGAPGQANYAAANAYLDSLAAERRRRGRHALSIDWGPIAGQGMAADPIAARRLQTLGLEAMLPEKALTAMGSLLQRSGPASTVVADLDVNRLRLALAPRSDVPLFESVTEAALPGRPRTDEQAAIWRRRLDALPPAHRVDALISMIQREVADVLGFDSAAEVDPRRGLQSLGMDSLSALTLRNRLEMRLGVAVPPTLVFEAPSVEAVARHVAGLLDETTVKTAERAVASRTTGGIAIVGAACRFPSAPSPEQLWDLLKDGGDAITEVPKARWDVDAWYDPDPTVPDRTVARAGGFIERVDEFDANLFRVSPREAATLDPQQRLLLELAWEALERAGIAPDSLRDTDTGMFVGIGIGDYASLQLAAGDAGLDVHTGTGSGFCFASGRLSHVFGTKGPSLSVDTACSSSLVSLHLACQSLRSGECRVALAAGVHLMLSPHLWVYLSKLGALSPRNRCATFDAAADGYVRGEGGGVAVLKRLEDAVADGDDILGVIHGSVVNHDGPSGGLTVPNGAAQEDLVRAALSAAGIDPTQLGYVEAHGTGTPLGDPIELRALGGALGRLPTAEPVWVGSVKANVGHLEAAAGMASLIKVLEALKHRLIPPQRHFTVPNPHVDWSTLPLRVPTTLEPWPPTRPYAGISSFGLSGTNAHVIVGPPPPAPPAPRAGASRAAGRVEDLLCLSARTSEALRALASRYAAVLTSEMPGGVDALCRAALRRRAHLEHRLALVIASSSDARGRRAAVDELERFAAGKPCSTLRHGQAVGSLPGIVFLYSGQGAQRAGMGRDLYRTEPAFRAVLDRCEAVVRQLRQTSLLERMFAQGSAGSQSATTLWVQPVVFAFEVALAELLISYGVRPMALVGHSVGEIAAAVTAGVMSVDDGMRFVCARASLMDAVPPGGAMLALGASSDSVQALVDESGLSSLVEIAAINAPTQIVCSGTEAAIARLEKRASARAIRAKRLDVSHAFHSRAMDPILDEVEAVVAGLALAPPRIPLLSNVTGALAQDEILTAVYWREHIRRPVRFRDQVASLRELDLPADLFVEVGPQPVLLQPLAECLGDAHGPLVACSRGHASETRELADALATLFVHGVKFERPEDDQAHGSVPLPTYPFQRERFWIDVDPPRPPAAGTRECDDLLGRRVQVAGIDAVFELALDAPASDWIEEHRVQGHAVVPAAHYLAAGRRLAALVAPDEEVELRDLTIAAPLLRARAGLLQVVVQAAGDGEWAARFSSGVLQPSSRGFLEHASLRLVRVPFAPSPAPVLVSSAAATGGEDIYRLFAERGLDYGPSFRRLIEVRSHAGISSGTLAAAEVSTHADVTLLDCALQATAGTFAEHDRAGAWVPVAVQRCALARLHEPGLLTVHARLRPTSPSSGNRIADVMLLGGDGEAVGSIEGVVLQALDADAIERWRETREAPGKAGVYRTEWRSVPDVETGSLSGYWILAGGPRDVSSALAAEIRRLGGEAGDAADETAGRRNDVRGVVCLHAVDAPPTISADEDLACVLRPTVEMVQSLLKSGRPAARLWLVTTGAHSDNDARAAVQASLWGLGTALSWEHPELLCTRVDIERGPVDRIVAQLVPLLASRSHENQFRVAGGRTLVPRLVRHAAGAAGVPSELVVPASQNYCLVPSASGRIDDLELRACERIEPAPGEVEVRVHASGLNFRDVLITLGVYPGSVPVLGGECCGVVTRVGEGVAPALLGARVLALAPGAFCRYATLPAASILPVPTSMSDEQAAGFPIVFLTAWYALRKVARLQPGERVLIHAAAGGVGQAAIQIARAAGAEIWATASTPKWDLLRRSGIEHLFDSRDVNAVRAIRRQAGAPGIDVVLNCLAGEFVDASLDLLRPGARFVELGKADLRDPAEIARQYTGVNYTAFDLATLPPDILGQGLEELLGALERGQLAPVAAAPFPLEQAVDVFRHMARGAHTGKITFVHPPARDEIVIRQDRCYVVTGGAGALGGHVAARLAGEGAREIVLVGRRSPDAGTAALVASLSNDRTRVSYRHGDVTVRDELERALALEEGSLPIGGVFHAAGTLDDGVFTALSWDRFERVLGPKAQGTLNLLSATRHHPVQFVVLFSSAAAVVGGAGQANYAAANAFMAALAQHGTTTTPRVLCVDWGPWAGGGMADRTEAASRERWARLGVGRLAPGAALDLLWQALRGSARRLCALDVDFSAVTARLGQEPPLLAELSSTPARPRTTDVKRPSLLADLAVLAEGDRPAALRPWLESTVREVLGGRVSGSFHPRQPLRDLGMDSLMAVELRNRIGAVTGISLPMSALFEHPSLEDLCRHIARQWAAEGAVTRASASAVRPAAAASEAIAIVGAACRLPGDVATLDSLWRLLETSGDAIQEVPPGRWALDDWYDPDPQAAGKMYTRWMGVVDDVDQFDPVFFGISPHEATTLDPQQRLLLELSWQALEHAGIPARELVGTPTGVFVGISTHDYGVRHVFGRGARQVDAFSGTGSALSAAAGRISYVLGLQGPSLSVDTACSSSLVALHLAARSLRSGESNLALVGGVNLVLAPEATVYFCRLGAMARDGRCKVFDDTADGYVRSDGCGVVVLKRLSDAARDGDRILAVVRGTAVNQDGRSNGLTAPNGAAQQAVIRAALADARLRTDEVGYVEAHGTGTALGDAVELDALRAVFAEAGRPHDLIVGSVKSNMGHLEAAAGIAGLLKAVLAVDRAKIPANAHLQSRNKNVSWDGITAPQTLVPWPANDARRRAGVSSFGFTGTNAHVVIEQAPDRAREVEQRQPPALLMPVSARSPRSLQAAAAQMAGRLEGVSPSEAASLCWNAGARRSHLDYRTAVHGRSPEALVAGLREQTAVLARAALPEVRPMFVFSGQGGQWRGMGRGLLRHVPAFAETMREVDTALGRWLDWSVCDLLLTESRSRATTPDVLQPLVFAMQVGLASLWRHMGVVPAAVVGHSMGEVAAALTAGALSLEDAARIIATRSRLAARLSGSGGMVLVSGRGEQIDEIVSTLPRGICVAARNSHASVVLSGDQAQIVELRCRLREAGTFTELVDVDFAAHSHHVDPLLDELGAALRGVVLSPPRIPMRSTVTLDYIAGGEGPEYWQANFRHPVQFHSAMLSEFDAGRNLVIEISPHPVLQQSIEQDIERAGRVDEVRALGSMTRTDGDDTPEFWRALAEAYAAGADLDWTRVSGGRYPVRDLPSMPFERRSFWIEATASDGRAGSTRGLPGARLDSAGREVLFEGELSSPVGDLAATALAGLVAAGLDVSSHPDCSFHDLTVASVVDTCAVGSRAQVVVRDEPDGLALALFVRIRNSWERVASGRLAPRADAVAEPVDQAAMTVCEGWDEARLHRACLNRGIPLGFAERVSSASVGEGLARFDLRLADGDDGVALSCSLARVVLAATAWSAPAAVDELTVRGRPCGGSARLTVSSGPKDSLRLALDADDGTWAIRMDGVVFRPASIAREPALVADLVSTFGTELRWRPASTSRLRPASHPEAWLVQDDGSGLARSIVERLAGQGRSATLIQAQALPDEWRSRAEAAGGGAGRVRVVFIAPLDLGSTDACAATGAALVHTFLALDDPDLLAPRGFHCLTRGAHAASPVPGQAALWALGRVCSLERPERWGTLVDVSADADAGTLIDSLLSTDDEDELRITRRSREALRLEPVRGVTSPSDDAPLCGPVLITGGLGHLGRLLVEWLRTQGIAHVVLTSRRSVDDRADAADVTCWLEAMRQSCTVDVHAIDASDGRAMRALLASYRQRQTPIRSAMHLAGESTPEPIERLTRAGLDSALRGKLGGARVLVDCAREEGLDGVVLFSSAAGVWGSTQMGAYAAANAALDALAAAHNRDGLRVCSIAWGRWRRGGLVNVELEAALARIGIEELAPDPAFAVLRYALAHSIARLTVASVDWARFSEMYVARRARPLLSAVSSAAGERSGIGGSLFDRLRGLRRAEAIAHANREILARLARVLGAQPENLDLDRGFLDMGLTSLLAVEVSRELTQMVGRKLPATLAFEHPTPRALAAELLDRFLPDAAAGPAPAMPVPPQPVPAGLEHLSDDLLAEKLLAGVRTLDDRLP